MKSKCYSSIAILCLACFGLGSCSGFRQDDSAIGIKLNRPVTIFPGGPAFVVIPATASSGIKAVDIVGPTQFVINGENGGEDIEIRSTGTVQVGPDRPVVGPDGETTGYVDAGVDSPFKRNVGGLEMWIGPDKTSGQRYLIGPYFHQRIQENGVPTFRVIDALPNGKGGYKGTGTFIVTIMKR